LKARLEHATVLGEHRNAKLHSNNEYTELIRYKTCMILLLAKYQLQKSTSLAASDTLKSPFYELE